MRWHHVALWLATLCLAVAVPLQAVEYTIWLSPLDIVTGDSRVNVGPGSPVYVARMTTSSPGDYQWVILPLQIPDTVAIQAIQLCYELEDASSFISQIRVTRLQGAASALVVWDDGTDLTSAADCYESVPPTPIEISGSTAISFRLNYASTDHYVEIGALSMTVSELAVTTPHAPDWSSGLRLDQNAPNPFNPTTRITYELQEADVVELGVFDVDGRLVRTLVQEPQSMGRYDVGWDGRDEGGREVPSGVYFYQLRVGERTASKQMVLTR